MYLMLLDTEDEKDKFVKLYNCYKQKMYYVANSVLHDEQKAEDMVHETFLTLVDNMNKISGVQCQETWNYIVTILKHKCYNWLKREKRWEYVDTEEENIFIDSGRTLENEIVKREMFQVLAEMIGNLKYPYKEVLYLKYYNQLQSKEIGKLLHMSSANVRKTQQRAKKQLENKLRKLGYVWDE
jgi:RNA polymerase sigma-70 factor (ECF subfamily)